ncbi:MAG: CAP domain-containing protein [Pricia sp.]
MIVLAVCTITLVSCSKESTESVNVVENENITEVEQNVLATVNEYRVSSGLNALKFDDTAYRYANQHTDYMIAKGEINHDRFTARASALAADVAVEFVAENVAKEYTTATEVFQGWLQSPNHRRTMEGDFNHTAVSVKKDSKGILYFTQIFYR